MHDPCIGLLDSLTPGKKMEKDETFLSFEPVLPQWQSIGVSIANYIMAMSALQNVAQWGSIAFTISFTSSTLGSWSDLRLGEKVIPSAITLSKNIFRREIWDGGVVWTYTFLKVTDLCTPILLVACSVQFSRSVMSDSLQPHESQHAKPPCPSPAPRVYSNSCPSSRWCHPAISSSVVPCSCPQSLPASGSFPMSQLFAWGGQSTGVLASASVLPVNSQDWSLGWTGWISLQSRGLSNTTVQKHQFFGAQFYL